MADAACALSNVVTRAEWLLTGRRASEAQRHLIFGFERTTAKQALGTGNESGGPREASGRRPGSSRRIPKWAAVGSAHRSGHVRGGWAKSGRDGPGGMLAALLISRCGADGRDYTSPVESVHGHSQTQPQRRPLVPSRSARSTTDCRSADLPRRLQPCTSRRRFAVGCAMPCGFSAGQRTHTPPGLSRFRAKNEAGRAERLGVGLAQDMAGGAVGFIPARAPGRATTRAKAGDAEDGRGLEHGTVGGQRRPGFWAGQCCDETSPPLCRCGA